MGGRRVLPGAKLQLARRDQGQPWTATLPTLQLLRDFGVDPRSDRVRRAVALVRDHCRWEHAGQRTDGWRFDLVPNAGGQELVKQADEI